MGQLPTGLVKGALLGQPYFFLLSDSRLAPIGTPVLRAFVRGDLRRYEVSAMSQPVVGRFLR